MFKKILVPLDGSENAEGALPWLKHYTRAEKAQVVLLRVVPTLYPGDGRIAAEERQNALDYMQGIGRQLNYSGTPARIIVRIGTPAASIVRVAQLTEADAIIMTTRGGSPVKRWLMGGVTEQVMRMSHVPVLVVHRTTAQPQFRRVTRILVPLDGSELAESILPWAENLAKFHRARLIFFHAYAEGIKGWRRKYEDAFDALRVRIVRLCQELRARGVKAQFRVRNGDSATTVLNAASRADLVAMATHGFGGFKRWTFGSVAEKVIHGSPVPVFIYKTPYRARVRAEKPELVGVS